MFSLTVTLSQYSDAFNVRVDIEVFCSPNHTDYYVSKSDVCHIHGSCGKKILKSELLQIN